MVAALVSTLLQGPSQTPTLAARMASGDQVPLCSSPSPAGEVTVAPRYGAAATTASLPSNPACSAPPHSCSRSGGTIA
eukprot:4663686-Alexandrium_andersonii.AAC.1